MTQAIGRRRGPSPDRVADLMDAAAEIFLAKGYDATSVQDIADAVGLLKGSLYHYVNSKEDFLFGIIEPVYEAAVAAVVPVAHTDREPLQRLADFVRAHVTLVDEHLPAFTIRIREFSQLSAERRESLRRSGEEYNGALQKILNDVRRSGDLAPGLDVRMTTLTLIGQLNSLSQWYHPGGRYSARRLGDQLAGMMVMSVASEKALQRLGATGLRAL